MNARYHFVTLVLWFVAIVASAQTKAPEDFTIIEEQPAGELRVYNRTGFTVREHEEGEEDDYRRYVTKGGVQDGIINIVFGADRSVYFQYIVSESYYEGWVRGTLSDDGRTITLPMGQYTAYTWSFDMGTQVWLMKYVAEDDTYVIDESVTEVTFDVSPSGVITMLGTDADHIISVVNRAFGDTFSYLDWEWHGMGDYQSVFTPLDSHVISPPEGLETQTLIATSGYHDGVGWDVYNTTVRMGFDGDDVWLQGLCGLMSSAWVRGTRSGDVITIPSGQELGAYYGAMLYLVSAVPDENAEPIVGDSFSFTYDAERDAWVSYDDIMANSSKSVIQYVNYYMGMTLSTHPDRVADVPEGLNLVEYTMTYQEPNNQGRLVSQTHTLKGTERDGVVYLQGFTPYQPDGFIVGTIGSDGQVVFKSPQYLGTFDDEESGFKYPIFFQAFDGYTGELKPQVTFTRDATTHVLSDPSCAIGIGINKTGLLCQQYLYNVELTPVVVEGPVNIGWCDDELATTLQPIGIDASGSSRISAAIHLPRTKLMHYEGMTITKLRFAVKPGFEKMSVWIRSQLDASSIVVQSVSDVVDGWNEVVLNTPLVIDGSDLYIGYTGTQPEGFKGILAYGDGDEYSSWLALDNQWADYHEDGLGKLYIQAVAEGVMQQRDATVISLTTDKMAYAPTETLIVSGELENLGATDLQGYTLNFNIDGSQVATQTSNQLLRPDEVTTFSRELPLSFVKEGRHEVSVTISNSPLPSAGQGATFYVYKSSYPRTLLLEHFTSLPCVNCPRDDAKLEEVVAGRSDVAWVSHHVGYADDEFTLEIERTLTRFGVDGNPYVMLDRTAFNEGEPPAFVISSYDASMVNTIFDYAATMPALVELKATTMTNDNELTITVSGEGKSFLTDLYPRAMLNVYLVEDQVTAVGTQAGDANKKQHDNIMRQMVTPVRGTLPTWEVSADGLPTFNTQLTTTLDPSWNQQQLRVVAFLTAQAPSGSGWPTGEVLNSVQTPVAASTAVTSVALATQQTGQWYSIDGRRVSSPLQKGLYIYNGKKIIK